MKKTPSQIKAIFKSKNFGELVDNFPQSYIEFMAFFPLFLFMLVPIIQLIHDFISPYSHPVSYATKIMGVFICALTFGVIALLLYICKKIRKDGKPSFKSVLKNNVPFIFFLFVIIMMIISTIINGFTYEALYGDGYRRESLFYFIGYFALYFPCAIIVSNQKLRAAIFYTLISTSIPMAFLVLLDHRFVKLSAFQLSSGVSGVFHQFNHYGYYLIVVILSSAVLFVKEKKISLRILCMVSFILNNITLIVNNTFGCYLACFIALIFACVIISIADKKLNWLSIAVFALFILITLVMSFWTDTVFSNFVTFKNDIGNVAENPDNAGNAGTGRWTLWTHTAEYIKEKPLFGFGVDGISQRLSSDTNGVNNRPHNEFLEYAVFFGIPAAIAYICGVFSVFLKGLKNRRKLDIYALAAFAAAFAYLVSSIFGNTMYYTAPFLFIMLGLAISKTVDS